MKINKLLSNLKYLYNKSDFSKNVFTLISGTAIAQLIPLLIAPILSRIYSPQDFGRLALYLSIVQIIGAIANGRYELAIVLPKKKKKGVQLTLLSILITIITSLLSLLIVLLFSGKIANSLGDPKLREWLFLVPVSVLMIGCFNALNYFNTRERTFKNIAKANIFKSFGGNTIQLALGMLKFTNGGLIIGQVFSHFFGNVRLVKKFLEYKTVIKTTTISDLKQLARRYIDFPKFSMSGIFVNIASLNVINFFISSFYSLSSLGFFALAYRYLGLPSALIGTAFSQVYMENLTNAVRNDLNAIEVFKKTLKKLTIISIIFLLFSFLFIKDVFIIYLGEKWITSGTYAQILIPLFAIRFIVSCLSITLIVIENQKKELLIHILLFTSSVIVIFVSIKSNLSITSSISLYSISTTIIYFIILIYIYVLLKNANTSRLNENN